VSGGVLVEVRGEVVDNSLRKGDRALGCRRLGFGLRDDSADLGE
jgi:hypothetical protein